ncbi:hypothetical protein PALU110988_10515 [Paenibacillus lupini]|uniref:hypothetical protein n=1 Tax=Paenibacillus lupini TaxID=1450204 RepID=UPI001422C4EA|nr:hypothetical protein [Paenibacillus lupini]NIK22423.1 putative nucleic acid-binding Zn-ribbon protein [Paenibacillus lupini]
MSKTLREWNEELESLRERASEREYLERRSDQLDRMLRNARNKISKLTAEHDREQEDVTRLERKSWANLFHSIMGNKEDRLKIERKEALAVALKLQEAQPAIIKLEQENLEVSTKLAAVHEAMNTYKQVLLQKEQFLRSGDPTASGRLSELDESLFREQTEMKEFREAASACRKLVEALSNASVKLDSAKDWGTYDMLGGGALSTSIKHSRMDEAQDYIHEAQHHLRQLQIELNDLKRTADLSVELGTMDKFADYFFDNLITDWIVQNQIKSSISDVNSQLSEATGLLVKLDNEVRASERRQEAIRQQRAAFIELFD